MNIKKPLALGMGALMTLSVCACAPNTPQDDSSQKDPIFLNNDYTDIYDYGDDYFRQIGQRVTLDLDSPEYIFNDFSDPIDENFFSASIGTWNNDGQYKHQGVKEDNIFLTTDGNLALRINGDFYRGEEVDGTNGIRTGAALCTDNDMGPGRFEIRMKAAPRSGAVSAFWTYQFDSSDPNVDGWHEIDIEVVGGGPNGSFDSIWYTTWQKASGGNNTVQPLEDLGITLNDNEWHTHTFDWYTDYMGTGMGRIDWFIDGVLTYYTESSVAYKSGNLQIGVWRPSEFGGTSEFESAYMLVDFVRYTPFLDMGGWISTNYSNQFNSHRKNFPTDAERIELTEEMLNERLANTGFENVDTASTAPQIPFKVDYTEYAAVGWLKKAVGEIECSATTVTGTDAYEGERALKVSAGSVEQNIDSVFENYQYNLSFVGKKSSADTTSTVLIRFYNAGGIVIGSAEISIPITSLSYQEYTQTITAPANCGSMKICVRSENGDTFVDNLSCQFVTVSK